MSQFPCLTSCHLLFKRARNFGQPFRNIREAIFTITLSVDSLKQSSHLGPIASHSNTNRLLQNNSISALSWFTNLIFINMKFPCGERAR